MVKITQKKLHQIIREETIGLLAEQETRNVAFTYEDTINLAMTYVEAFAPPPVKGSPFLDNIKFMPGNARTEHGQFAGVYQPTRDQSPKEWADDASALAVPDVQDPWAHAGPEKTDEDLLTVWPAFFADAAGEVFNVIHKKHPKTPVVVLARTANFWSAMAMATTIVHEVFHKIDAHEPGGSMEKLNKHIRAIEDASVEDDGEIRGAADQGLRDAASYSAESEARRIEHLFHQNLIEASETISGQDRVPFSMAVRYIGIFNRNQLKRWKRNYDLTGPGYDEGTPGEPWK